MDSFEVNKIVAAILLVALLVIGIAKISNIAYHIEKPETAGYKVELPETTITVENNETEKEPEIDISTLLAMGSLEDGANVFKKCSACHSIEKGGENKIGPALYNVIGRNVASLSDYKYSNALVEYSKSWSFEEMNGFLKKPQAYIKGTKMAFAGLGKDSERASVILYLNQNSDNPLPLP